VSFAVFLKKKNVHVNIRGEGGVKPCSCHVHVGGRGGGQKVAYFVHVINGRPLVDTDLKR